MTKKINFIFLIILLLYTVFCALQLGYTWDVLFYYHVGKERLDYLLSLGLDNFDTSIHAHKYLTGAYSTISAFVVQFFPKKFLLESLYLFNLIFSILAVFGIYKISKEFFNKKIGKITFLICFFNPIFFGHMAMNGIDTIIAFSNIWLFYIIIKYLKKQLNQKKRNSYVMQCGLILGLGLGVRYSFLITLIPIFLFLILEIYHFKIFINKDFSKRHFFEDSLKVLFIAYLFMVFFWPHTHQNIFWLPFKLAMESFSFGFGVPFILSNGEIFLTNNLPKNYILINLFYKMPEFLLLSFAIFIAFYFKIGSYFVKQFKGFNFKIFTILIIILFPNILFLFSPYSIYDGVRLFLYLIPFICIIPALVFFFLFKMIKDRLYKFIFLILISLKIFLLFNFISLTPYQYVYLNIFAGKYSENYKKFENDYWGVSTKKLISHINQNREIFGDSKIKVAICGLEKNTQKKYLKKIKNFEFELVDVNENFDYIIMNNRVVMNVENESYDSNKAQTCFQKYFGEDLITVERRGLILTKITKI